ncbi:TonB-dependent receptor plug domain-containing protein [Bowmanella denitrificans]|uniref:TonB-dependent receptor plug domain-containing protein n=1 Tax=Bowmanella denitrificans TaxID=366582 RepID=UPI000C9BB5CF|nr:TonB-dependent receptor [Bowmanella denitrificans]
MPTHINKLSRSIRIALTSAATVVTTFGVNAQDQSQGADTDAPVEKIAIVGTRAAPRSVGDSAVPLDIVGGDDFARQGATDIDKMMMSAVPSFTVNEQPINDASTLVRPANLRGLASDQTLILVNGKRKNRSAVITFLGGSLSDGAQGPDISTIPAIALRQIEVLRDGAAAQYGSDAIAGVINFSLKNDSDGGQFEARYGSYYEGDGDMMQYSGNVGLPLTDDGFANLSFEYREADPTSRSIQRPDAAAIADAGNEFVANPAQVWGNPEIKYDYKMLLNTGLDLGNDKEAYMWTSWSEREVEGGFYYRHPHTRGGVYSNDGGETLLVGDLTPNDGIDCPVVPITANVLTSAAYQQVANDPNCWAFNEMFPGGFTPSFGGVVFDASIVMGTKGELSNGIMYDVSASFARSEVEFSISNTVNPSLGPDTPNSFSPGQYNQTEKGLNLDLSYPMEVDGWDEPINIAGGLEWRRESFEIQPGNPASYEVGLLAYDPATGESQGFGIGSNGFPGFKPEDAGTWSRGNVAAYVDVEAYLSDNFMVGVAARYEDYTDFGSTFNGKLAARWQLNDDWALRGAASTGFRAPSVGQSNVRNVTTAFVGGRLQDQATLPPTHPISLQKGGKQLEPEESVNLSFGLVGEFDNGLYMTIDYFNIKVTDRISQTSSLTLTPADIEALLALGQRDATSFTSIRYFTNDFDTRTQGVDLVMNYSMDMFGGDTKLSLAANYTDTEVLNVGPDGTVGNIGANKVMMLEDNLPDTRFSVTADHTNGDWRFLARINYFGDYFEDHVDDGTPDARIYPGAETTLDVEMAYNFTDNLSVVVGAQNALDNTPDDNPLADWVGSAYPTTAPMGINGGFYYIRGIYNF